MKALKQAGLKKENELWFHCILLSSLSSNDKYMIDTQVLSECFHDNE